MLWYFHGKDLNHSQLPAYEILQEWYKVLVEEKRSYVRPQRPARSPADAHMQHDAPGRADAGSSAAHLGEHREPRRGPHAGIQHGVRQVGGGE